MALRRETIQAIELQNLWRHAVLDDITLSNAVRAHGGRVHTPRDLLVPSPASFSWKDAISFGRRQYLFVRMHAPRTWMLAAAVTTVPLVGWATALPLAVTGHTVAIGTIVVANLLDHFRAYFRRRIPRKLWGTEISARVAFLDQWATPAWLALHAFVVWSTLWGRSITWHGRTYSIDRRQNLRRLSNHFNSDKTEPT